MTLSRDKRINALRTRVGELQRVAVSEWAAQLDPRKQEEIEFHDQVRAIAGTGESGFADFEAELRDKVPNQKYYAATAASHAHITNWIAREARDRIVVDYACGVGAYAITAAKAGAALVIGIDISGASIEVARRFAEHAGVGDRCVFYQGDCENTGLPPESVDAMICAGMLHHLDLSYAFPEMRRILVPGGRVLAAEALNYNPFITLYRQLTPELRTTWEKDHILSLSDLRFARRFFEVQNVRCWHFLSPVAAFLPGAPLREVGFRLLDSVDGILARTPLVRWMAWMFTFELQKAIENG